MPAFVRWWMFMNLVLIGNFIAYKFNVFTELYEKDFTKLSFIILVIFYFISFLCGLRIYKVSRVPKSVNDYSYYFARRDTELVLFSSEICMALGMLGTICGFIVIAFSIGQVDITQAQTTQTLLSDMGSGMATAFYTTFVGLLCSILLQIQHFHLEHLRK